MHYLLSGHAFIIRFVTNTSYLDLECGEEELINRTIAEDCTGSDRRPLERPSCRWCNNSSLVCTRYKSRKVAFSACGGCDSVTELPQVLVLPSIL